MRSVTKFIEAVKSTPVYQQRADARKLVEASESRLLDLEREGDNDALQEAYGEFRDQMAKLLGVSERFPTAKPKAPSLPETPTLTAFLEKCEQDYQATRAKVYDHYELFIPGTSKIKGVDGKEYEFPSWTEVRQVVKSISDLEEKLKLMQEPRVNITALIPIQDYKKAIDAKKIAGQNDTYIWPRITDKSLRYEIQKIHPTDHGGITKRELCEKHKGFLITVDDDKEKLEAHADIQKGAAGKELTIKEKQQKYFKHFQQTGRKGSSYEQALCQQMRALQEGRKLDELSRGGFGILTNTIIDGKTDVQYSEWDESRVGLDRDHPGGQVGGLRCRSSLWGERI